MTFPINTAIPNVNDDPADDVTPMNTNFVNINDYLQVDHVAPGSQGLPGNGGAGTHEQVTYNNKNEQGAQIDPTSVLYTSDGSVVNGFSPAAASTVANLIFRNQRGKFPGSVIKAFGVFTVTNTPPGLPITQTLTNGFNVSTVKLTGIVPGTYTITLTSNSTVFGVNNALVLAWNSTTNSLLTATIASANVITVLTGNNAAFAAGNVVNFVVLQF